MSSLFFIGNSTSYLRIPHTNEFNFGTGDFTIEWYQYQTDSNLFPRIFQVGDFSGSGVSIGVSIEAGSFYYWTNDSPNYVIGLSPSSYKNVWVHFAISRSSGVTQIFMDGVSIFSMSDTNNFNDSSSDLVISNESTPSNDAAFGGYMTYFSWVKGVALYTSNFSVSNTYPPVTGDTVLLLTAEGFSGTLGSTVQSNSISTSPFVPANFGTVAVRLPPSRKSLFVNNAMVFYKRGSLSSGGGGTVRNSSAKARRT